MIEKRLPAPRMRLARTCPPCSVAMDLTIASPKPDLFHAGFVAAKGVLEDMRQDIGWDAAAAIDNAHGQTPFSLICQQYGTRKKPLGCPWNSFQTISQGNIQDYM